ncbi:chromatin binding protein [Coemansia sp. Benny D115]|nr:chromatin binding protein [Coemansia sp. Benny D115]
MNRKLLDPFAPEYPESIEACLDDEFATHCAFSHHGSLLATARSDGQCFIWDMDTLNVMRRLKHGDAALTGLSWSRSGRYLLTYDEEGECVLWDLKNDTVRARVVFDSGIACARVHPRDGSRFVACPAREAPCIVSVRESLQDGERADVVVEPICLTSGVDQKTRAAAATCCCFGRRGEHVFFGTSKGLVAMADVATRQVVCATRLSGSTVSTLARNPRGTDIVANSADRIIRVCRVKAPSSTSAGDGDGNGAAGASITVAAKIQDIVNRVHWAQAVFSASGDYIVSGIEHKAEHNVYVWDKLSGALVKMLTGPNELLEDCAVHPLRPIYASISTFGIIYLWTRVPQQNWNAFAPGFRELEENIDYVEPEDLFDRRVALHPGGPLVDCAHLRQLRERPPATDPAADADSDIDVDVTGVDPLFSDSDSDAGDEHFVLPVDVRTDSETETLPPSAGPAPLLHANHANLI